MNDRAMTTVQIPYAGTMRAFQIPAHRLGEVVVPNQLVDATKLRINTFLGDGLVAHVSVADPFCPCLSELVADAVESVSGPTVHRGGKLVTI